MRAHKYCLLVLICFLLFNTRIVSQTFTRVTDPSCPIVSDRFNSGGGSWADINNDGFLDLFVANGNDSSQTSSLYLNNGKGNFIKVTMGPIVNDSATSIGGSWGDYNNDGKPDLFLTNRKFSVGFGNFMYRGNGDTVFSKVTTGSPATDVANSNSSSWVDINGDGNLDLFIVNFQGNNYLYYNGGPPSYTFTRVDTGDIVLDGNAFSIVGAWADYNNDGKPDLFIGNAGTQNDLLFTNTGNGGFTKTILADGKASLGASWGDYDNDGYLDLFVANYSNQSNILYHNSGPPNFVLTRVDTGIASNDGGNSVGSVWGDFDNDGDLDLFVCNDGQNNALYLNNGPPTYGFTKVTTGVVVNDGGSSFGCAAADFDNNGSLDLFVANHLGRQNFLYTNNGNGNKWVNIKCVGTTANKSAIGTKVRVRAIINGSPRWQMQEVSAQSGYNSQNLVLHFGLGDASQIDSVKIEWHPGSTETYTGIAINKNITVTQNSGISGIARSVPSLPELFHLEQNYPNPFNPTTNFRFSIPQPQADAPLAHDFQFVTLRIFDLLGREVAKLISEQRPAGEYDVQFDASKLASGVYLYKLQAGNFVETKKMILMK